MFKFLRKKKPEKSQFEHLNENLKTTDFRVAFDALEAGHRVEIVTFNSGAFNKKHQKTRSRHLLVPDSSAVVHTVLTWTPPDINDQAYIFACKSWNGIYKDSYLLIYPKRDFRWRVKSLEEIMVIAERQENGSFKMRGQERAFDLGHQPHCGKILPEHFYPDDDLQEVGPKFSEWMLEKVKVDR